MLISDNLLINGSVNRDESVARYGRKHAKSYCSKRVMCLRTVCYRAGLARCFDVLRRNRSCRTLLVEKTDSIGIFTTT
jgi:hypothetical protein